MIIVTFFFGSSNSHLKVFILCHVRQVN